MNNEASQIIEKESTSLHECLSLLIFLFEIINQKPDPVFSACAIKTYNANYKPKITALPLDSGTTNKLSSCIVCSSKEPISHAPSLRGSLR